LRFVTLNSCGISFSQGIIENIPLATPLLIAIITVVPAVPPRTDSGLKALELIYA